ncbi:Srpr [Ecytonucleospora hepatopenaei]|uniref:Signal recognition particle receptor subunit alpha homolog n=1 Tax=Ecytonucleospora hepatopenaei TaxID=646526 RepID=A0A1W0E5K3_9MICR|nr:Srpr [Ecytonucleospora hepatopenaei]
MLNQTRDYFLVFDKRGFVFYETGPAPYFLDEIIIKLDLTNIHNEKKIRDKFLETKTEGDIVYLCYSTTNKHLEEFIENYKKTILKQKDSEPEKTFNKWHERIKNKTFGIFSNKIKLSDLVIRIREKLVNKNIEPKYAESLIQEISGICISQDKEWIIENDFKNMCKNLFENILPSINHKNLLHEISDKKAKGEIFSFCFVGVNGVGKSTSLAKMTRWLLQNEMSVFIAACDTFRAGAVEQLKVHVDRFVKAGQKVGFYESGYNKDDATVAKNAIEKAKLQGYDVVLIDTAGRMHANKVLMSSLSKLIRVNNPTHIIYVGEALTGNDGVDFINEFNNCISVGKEGRKINSIILTKVDTVGEKIGNVFNLTFKTKSPILFLGCGQTNADLVEMDSEQIAHLLLN